MNKTTLAVPTMDCAAEEQLIRMAFEGRPGIVRLAADLSASQLQVIHEGDAEAVAALVRPLNLGGEIIGTCPYQKLERHEDESPATGDWRLEGGA